MQSRFGRARGGVVAVSIVALMWASLATTAAVMGGCGQRVDSTPNAPPAPTWSGPGYLRGTIGSMAGVRNYEPLLVEGYGVVIGLDGTGSAELPMELRERLLNHARQMGVGSSQMARDLPEQYQAFAQMSPERLLRSRDTALVAVQGFVPPGAAAGTRFDVLVSALPGTQTTSLAGGVLWTTDLSVGGTAPELGFTHPRADASGPIYLEPYDSVSQELEALEIDEDDHLMQAVVVNGGRATRARSLELVLNQPAYPRARAIADRINERFPTEPGERGHTANAVNATTIELQIPRRYQDRPEDLMALISHTYIGGPVGYEQTQARRLGRVLETDIEQARSVILAWHSLGRTVRPVVREYYEHEELEVHLAALEAGARLEDERASEGLLELSEHADAAVRQRVAEVLVYLPRSLRGGQALGRLVDDDEPAVRIAAYETLARQGDRDRIDRFVVGNRTRTKFVIDRVEAERPMIYVTPQQLPRVVIFGPELSLRNPMFASLWDNRLVLRANEEPGYVELYYQRRRAIEGERHKVDASVAALAFALAHEPSADLPMEGLNLSYAEVVEVLSHLVERGVIEADLELRRSPLAQAVAEAMTQPGYGRPELAEGEVWDDPLEEPGYELPDLDDPPLLNQPPADGGVQRPSRLSPAVGPRSRGGVQREGLGEVDPSPRGDVEMRREVDELPTVPGGEPVQRQE